MENLTGEPRVRPVPDEFNEPEPHPAASESVVSQVLSRVSTLGTSLISVLTSLLAAVLILYSGYVLYDTFYTQNAAASSSWDLLQYKPTIIEAGAEPMSGENVLAAINADYRGWLTVYDTNIDYPVMQSDNDLYYASHDIYGASSLTGALYFAAGNTPDASDSYNLIYGHHMDNGAMFGALDRYFDADYLQSHREGILVGTSGIYDLYAFASFKTDAYENEVYTVGDCWSDVLAYLQAADGTGATTIMFFDEDVAQEADRVLALSTCASAETNGRFVVLFRMTRRDMMLVTATGYEGAYDAQPHGATWSISHPVGATVEFSTDGHTWTSDAPTITEVGDVTVTIRATHATYGRSTATVHLIVTERDVTVRAAAAEKQYGMADPSLSATVEGVVDNATIAYSVSRPGAGTDETVGTYDDAIVPAGEEIQGNYRVTYVPAPFTITPSDRLRVSATGYDGVYDAAAHAASASATVTDGTTISYSVDGGATWTASASITNVGETTVLVRAENPNYITAEAETALVVRPRPVTVTAQSAMKMFGRSDPRFTATETGLLGRDRVTYTVTRPGVGTDEDIGVYEDAIVPAGETLQGNYTVSYVAAPFTITASNELVLLATGFRGTFDAQKHAVSASVNVTAGTVIEYSTDGGTTWTRIAPFLQNVGEATVLVRATNRNFEVQQQEVTLSVLPAAVTVRAKNASKIYGTEDPAFAAEVLGLLDRTEIVYTVSRPGAGTEESVGTYADAIVPAGDVRQGNYAVTCVPGSFEIVAAHGLSLDVTSYDGVYDGTAHTVTASASHPTGGNLTVEYSTDGGATYSMTAPRLTNVGEANVTVRVSAPGYEPVETTVLLRVTPRHVTVTANNVSKAAGANDPVLEATLEDVLDGEAGLIEYTVVREPGEERGSYVIRPEGEERQGNYLVTYIPGKLIVIGETTEKTTQTKPILPTAMATDDTEQDLVTRLFLPRGSKNMWALLNLILMILTVYLLIPLLHLRDKYGRARRMKRVNNIEDEQHYKLKKFRRKFYIGVGLETLVAAAAVIIFVLTENMRLPMTLIDQWTPLMILLLLVIWLLDLTLIRYRDEKKTDRKA